MSLFPRSFTQELSPLFRMMDDYATLTRDFQHFPTGGAWKSLRSFQPKFDVSESKEAYQLHGELPGIAQKDINIEWTDGNTLTISGRTETRSESGTQPGEQGEATEQSAAETHYEKPSVEDESGNTASTTTGDQAGTSTEVATASTSQEVTKPQPKYWISERSLGEFSRSFSFPARVDQNDVSASLKDGILEITVPKVAKPVNKKIEIQSSL